MSDMSLFEQWMFEAPGDDPAPDIPDDTATPDVPADDAPAANDPPDLGGDDIGGDAPDDAGPPDLGGDDFGGDDFGGDDNIIPEEGAEDMGLSEKISSILNLNLYQSYLELISQIGSQISSIKNNADLLYAITPDVEIVSKRLKDLDENIRLYIDNHYTNEKYEKNRLFYNKCKNFANLINQDFNHMISSKAKEKSTSSNN